MNHVTVLAHFLAPTVKRARFHAHSVTMALLCVLRARERSSLHAQRAMAQDTKSVQAVEGMAKSQEKHIRVVFVEETEALEHNALSAVVWDSSLPLAQTQINALHVTEQDTLERNA